MSRQSRDVVVATVVAAFMVGAVYVLMAGSPRPDTRVPVPKTADGSAPPAVASSTPAASGTQALTAGDGLRATPSPSAAAAGSARQAYEIAADRYKAYRDFMSVDGAQRAEARYYAARTAMECMMVLHTSGDQPPGGVPLDSAAEDRRQAALLDLRKECGGFGAQRLDALALRAESAMLGFAPAMADELATQYVGGVVSADEAWQRAQMLARSDDPRVYEGLGAYAQFAGVDIAGPEPARDRAAAYHIAWQLVVCRAAGSDCGPSGRLLKLTCALNGLCKIPTVEAAATAYATPQQLDLANRYAGQITNALRSHDLVALGLDRARPYVPPKE